MKRKLVNRLFAAFLSFTMVFSDLNIPAFAAENGTVSENIVSEIVSENETEEDTIEIEAEETEDLSVSEDAVVVESVSEDTSEEAVAEEMTDDTDEVSENEAEEDYSGSEEEIIAEENWDGGNGAGAGTSYDDAPSTDWGRWCIAVGTSTSTLYVDNVYMNLHADITGKDNAVPTATGGYKLLIHGRNVAGTVNLNDTVWSDIKNAKVIFRPATSSGSKAVLSYSITDFLPYVTEICVRNLNGMDAASAVFSECKNATKITFCDDASDSSQANRNKTISALSGSVFKGLTKLQSVILPSAVTSLSAEYFSGCTSLTSVTGSNFTTIPDSCFYKCTSLTSIPNATNVTSIGASAFEGCTALTTAASGATSVGNRAFYGCENLTTVPSAAKTIGSDAFYNCKKITSVPSGATSIGEGAFTNCFALTTVNCSSLTSIGKSAFNCSGVSSITIPSSCSIGESAFESCAFKSVDVSNYSSIGNNAFYNNKSLTSVTCNTFNGSLFTSCPIADVTINGSGALDSSVKSFSSTLTTVTAPNVTSIADKALMDCSKLTTVNFGKATAIGEYAFKGCSSLATATFGNVTTVGQYAFSGCSKITQSNIDISKLTSIGTNAFQNTGVTVVTLNSTLTDFPNAFAGCKLTSITMPGVQTIGNSKFTAFKSTLKTVEAPIATLLGESAFEGCTALTTVNMESLQNIGKKSFKGCTGLKNVTYSSVTTIGDYAFSGCTGITGITFPAATTIGLYAFADCSSLATLSLAKVSTIEDHAFENCPITSLSLASIKTIGESAFEGCSELKSAAIESATTVYKSAFKGCENLGALYLRDIELISDDAFSGIGNALSEKPIIQIPAKKNISIAKGAFVGNLDCVKYDDTQAVWNEKVSLGSSDRREVFGEAYILFADDTKLYPDATPTPDPTATPTPTTTPGGGNNDVTPTPSTPSDGTLSEEDIENLIKKIIEIVITGKPDPTDADAVQKWLDAVKELAEKYNIDIEALITKALENIDNPTELEKVINQIIDKFKETVKDTVNTLVNTAPSSTDSKELIEWWFQRIKELAKENNWTDLYNLTLAALDNIDDETKRADYLAQLLALLKEKQSAVTPTPTPTPATDEGEKTDPNAKYYHAIFYTYYDNAPHVYVENNIIEGGSVLNIPKAEYDGYTFMGWYEIASLTTNKPVRWYVGTPVYKNLALSAIFVNDKGEIKVIIPDEEFPIKGELDPANPPAPVAVTPGDGNSNNITNINFNILPSKGGLGDLSASGLDSFIDFGAITKNNTEIYMVKGQKVIDSSVNVVSGDAKIVKVKLTKNGTLITAKKDGTTTLSVTNRTSGVTYQCKVNVVTPKMSAKSITIAAGQTANATIACGSYTNKYPIYWASSNVDVAYVEASTTHGIAVVHGIGKGSATITAYINGKAYKVKVKVKETAKIDSVAGTITINPMETVNIAKSGLNGMDGFNPKGATWTYGTAGIVEINDSGIMTGKAYGTTTVTGVAKDGARKQFTVKVTSASPRTLHINMGQSKKISLYKVPAKKAVFKSSNTEVATVNESGKVNAHSAGVALITANYMGYVYRYYVYVENPTLMNTSNLSGSGKKYSLGINKGGLSHLAVIYADQPVIFSSKKPEIVFVDENGFVRGRNAGVGDISTKVNKLSIKIKTTVF